jgi:hypothetical protein
VLLLAGGGVALWRTTSSSGYHPATAKSWPPGTADVIAFVEKTRGLTFSHPVPIDFLPSDEFAARMNAKVKISAADQAMLDVDLHIERALGLVQGQIDLAQAIRSYESQAVIGLYDGQSGHLWVRGSDLNPFVRTTLAHELTHALQDEHFRIFQRSRNMTPDQKEAFQALYEGDAHTVEQAYFDQLSDSDKAAYNAAQASLSSKADLTGVPQQLQDDVGTPYEFGPTFVAALRAAGGVDELNRAFEHPPSTFEEVLDPTLYTMGNGQRPVPIPALHSGERALKADFTFTKLDLLEVLGDRIGYDAAVAGASGWERGALRAFSKGGMECVRVDGLTSDPTKLDGAFAQWATADGHATVSESGDIVQLVACDPGPDAHYAPSAPRAFLVYSLRATLLDALLKEVDLPLAQCAVDDVISHVGAAPLVADDQLSDPNDPRLAALRSGFTAAALRCRGQGFG